jgi:hypothetical protein
LAVAGSRGSIPFPVPIEATVSAPVRGIPGNQTMAAIVSPVMAVNPDPKPGRWILPLVILGMIAFTYFFVRSLPEASPDTTLAASGPTTTGPVDGATTTTLAGGGTIDTDAVQVYLAELNRVSGELQVLNTELVAVNTAFDNDREIEFSEAAPRMDAVAAAAQALSDGLAALAPPVGLEANHEALAGQISLAARAAEEAVSGIRSSDPGDLRRAAVAAFTAAVTDFDVEVGNAETAAGVAPDA